MKCVKCYLHYIGEEGIAGRENASLFKYKIKLFGIAYLIDFYIKSSP